MKETTNINVQVLQGSRPGKTVVILAGVHGNELPGIKAFERLLPRLTLDAGKAFFILANCRAIKENKRFIECNLNRCFTPDALRAFSNSVEGKTAKEIIPFFNESDALLDIHASNSKESTPFIICNEESIEIASHLPISIVTFGWNRFEAGSTEHYFHEHGKRAVGIECGYLLDPKGILCAEQSILAFLSAFGLINNTGDASSSSSSQELFEVVNLYKNVNAPFRKLRDFSDFEPVKTGDCIGYDGPEQVRVEEDALVLFVRDREKVGEECFLLLQRKQA